MSNETKSNIALVCTDIYKSFRVGIQNRVQVLDGISFELSYGNVCGLVGPNGTGKTTFMKILSGLMRPDTGEVICCGKQCFTQARIYEQGYMSERPAFPQWMNAFSFLYAMAGYYVTYDRTIQEREYIESILACVGLDQYKKDISTYSKGMIKRLALAHALLHKPKVLVLDEPYDGLDPLGIRLFSDCLHKLKKEGVAVIFTTHLLHELIGIADELYYMKEGRLIKETDLTALDELCLLEKSYNNIFQVR